MSDIKQVLFYVILNVVKLLTFNGKRGYKQEVAVWSTIGVDGRAGEPLQKA